MRITHWHYITGAYLALFLFSAHAEQNFRPDGCGFDETISHMLNTQGNSGVQTNATFLSSQTTSDGEQAGPQGTPIYTIPVVFHVVHGGGVENITDQQIQETVRQLNEDYNGLDPNRNDVVPAFANIYANVGLRFALARKDPNGNPTDGITRNYDPNRSTVYNDGNESSIKPTYGWPRNKYLNVFVVRSAGGESGSAWAYLPGVGSSLDGVISSHWAVGRSGTATPTHYKIMTHEVGHWANLHHTFQGGCVSPGSNSNGDLVADTPPTQTGADCNLNSAPCGELANTQNYMDYGYCTIMFTTGQENRMRAAIEGSASQRNSLWQTSNLQATGVIGQPVSALFYTTKNVTAVGGQINFTDISEAETGIVTTWEWSFPGGTPSSHNGRTPPAITYNSAGVYAVTLKVTNSSGNTNTVTKSNYINVSNDMYMHSGTERLCSGSLKDSGFDGSYGNREDHVLTLLPSNTGSAMRLSFSSFSLENSSNCANDYLKIYNGSNVNAPLIGTYCGSSSPSTVTANNSNGALHLVFHSNMETRATGWNSSVSCVGGGSNQSPTAEANGPYSGTVGSAISFSSSGSSDPDGTIASYSWNFGNGSTSTAANPSHSYSSAGAYTATLTVTDNQGASSSDSATVTVTTGSGSATALSNGVPQTGISASTGQYVKFYIDVPSGQSSLNVVMSGGSGDADMYVRLGSEPTDSTYDCRPYRNGNSETCTFTNPASGRWYINLKAYSSFSGVTLTANFTTGSSTVPNACSSESPYTGNSLSDNDAICVPNGSSSNTIRYFYIYVPSGATRLVIQSAHGSGNGNVYYNASSWATSSAYTQNSTNAGNTESITVNNPGSGYRYISVIGNPSGMALVVDIQ